MNLNSSKACLIVALMLIILGASSSHGSASAAGGSSISFTNFELGDTAGTLCPNTNGNCTNFASEPAIHADKSGAFYASSENGLGGGTVAWKSTDGGLHYNTLVSPNSVSQGTSQTSPAGGDTDVAVAPRRNTNGFFNVYVASLGGANVYVSTSKDGGKSWFLNPTGATILNDDRPWIAADGANKVCVSYRAPVPATDIFVTCSLDGGLTFTQTADAFDANHLFLGITGTRIGNLAIDPNNHVIYQAFSGRANSGELACLSCRAHVVWVAISIDGGKTFADHVVYVNPNTSVGYGHQFVNVSVDSQGNIYLVFTDDHNLFYSFSTNFGTTWSSPAQINQSPSNTAIMPWSVASSAGSLDVVWYGTSFFDGVNAPGTYPMSVAWYVFFAQNLKATTSGSSFTQVIASPIVHFGGVCEGGVLCTGNRDLFDDFGISASPVTGLASIVYSDDQFTNSTAEPTGPFCSPNQTNTLNCDRTNIATQVSGPGIVQKLKGFEVDDEDFEELDISNPSSPRPDFSVQIANTGTQSIASLAVTINGLPLSVTWSSTQPLQPGQSVSGHTNLTPTGLLLTLGGVYQTSFTATLSDGSTVTQTSPVIYTLGAGIGL